MLPVAGAAFSAGPWSGSSVAAARGSVPVHGTPSFAAAAPEGSNSAAAAAVACGSLSGALVVGSRVRRAKQQRRQTAIMQGPVALHAEGSTQQAPYGSWESPITPRFITTSGVGLGGVKCAPDGTLLWLEGRPQEGGRQVVCRRATSTDADVSERGGVEVTPAGSNARTRVHEYGGGAHVLGPEGDGVIYSNFADQRLYWVKTDGSEMELTPKSVYEQDTLYRFADAVLDVKRGRLICVREDHTNPKPSEVVNSICAVSLDGTGEMQVLAEGRDFYAAPRLSPEGDKLAFLAWDHPNMPWDSTQLSVARLDETGAVSAQQIVYGDKSPTSVLQPSWSPSGELHFMSDSTGWWNLYKFPKDQEDGPEVSLCQRDAEFSGSAPGWRLGDQNYCFLPDGRLVTNIFEGGSSLMVFLTEEAGGMKMELAQSGLPRLIGSPCPSPDGKKLYFMGGDPYSPAGIYEMSVPEPGPITGALDATMIVCSMSESMRIDPGFVSAPELVEFPTGSGDEVAYGYYYSPSNKDFKAPADTKPPLLVKAHGGPTACAGVGLNPGIQFWTSRGFAVLDVDYRGSTGYGSQYRQRLKGNWGVTDVEDVCAGADHLAKQGLVNAEMLAIDGGSAGGFTTLAAMTFRDVFKAGCSLYGVADLAALAGDTHKFESRYLDGLVGKYPEESETFDARAPIKHVDKLSCPILLLQGAEDKIVPPNQAEMMYDVAKAKGLPCALKVYEGEQHGFRRSENIEDALMSELLFYSKVFGFQVPGEDQPTLEIANLE